MRDCAIIALIVPALAGGRNTCAGLSRAAARSSADFRRRHHTRDVSIWRCQSIRPRKPHNPFNDCDSETASTVTARQLRLPGHDLPVGSCDRTAQMSPTSDEPHAARARQGSAKEQTYGDGPEQCEQSFRCAAIGIVRLRAVKHERRAGRAKNLSCLKSRIIVWDRPSGADALQQPAGSRSVPRGRSVHYASTDPRAVPVSILCQRASVQKGA